MNLRRTGWLLVLAALFCMGCRKDAFVAQWIDEMNNRNRELEDIVREQEYELDILKEKLERAEKNGSSSRKPRSSSSSGGGLFSPPASSGSRTRPPTMEPEPDLMDLEPPVIETPMQPAPMSVPEIESPPATRLEPPALDIPAAPAETNDPLPAVPRVEPAPATPAKPNPAAAPHLEMPQPERSLPSRPAPEPEIQSETLPPRTPRETKPVVLPAETNLTRPPQFDLSPPTSTPAAESATDSAVEELPAPPRRVQEGAPTANNSADATPRGRPSWIAPPPKPPADLAPDLPSPEETLETAQAEKNKPTHLIFNAAHTGGIDLDGRPGDDGLQLLIEPHNGLDEYIAQVGKVSVVLLDPALEGAQARVARWDFDVDEVSKAQSVLTSQRGIALQMPWPTAPPQHNTLRLFVRLETPEGVQIQADQELYVNLPGQVGAARSVRPNAAEGTATTEGPRGRDNSWTPRAGEQEGSVLEGVARRPAGQANPNRFESAPLQTPAAQPITPPATIREPARPSSPATGISQPFKPQLIKPPPALGEQE